MNSKDKWVRRFSVDETAKHKNGFTIYKITSVLFPIDSPEAVTVVSVWKRYSDVQRLHKAMRTLHAGLHLRGNFPRLTHFSYFKRFQQEVIEERSKVIKSLLEFIADHRLLFTSTDFVDFLETGYPEPESNTEGVINAIRSSLHLPIEDTPPLEYNTDDDQTPVHTARPQTGNTTTTIDKDETDHISQITIYEAAEVEIRKSPKNQLNTSQADSFESLTSLDSIKSDYYDEISKMSIDKPRPTVKKSVLPDLINFDAPSTSRFDDYHTMRQKHSNTNSETASVNSTIEDSDTRISSKLSFYSRKSVTNECKTDDSYVFEAGYMLNSAARFENSGEYQKAFECYKSGIEKMLIGVQTDPDPQRRALIKEKTNKYLSYAEDIYKNHLSNVERKQLLPEELSRAIHCPLPITMLNQPYEELVMYRVIAVIGSTMMLVLYKHNQKVYAMKVIQKVPYNLTEFDEYFLQTTKETRSPILPTNVPYMVPIHAYIESNNLIFLILSYAPGQNLFDYIKNYALSLPNTPAREVNLNNVFTEPTKKGNVNHNIDRIDEKLTITVDTFKQNSIEFIDDGIDDLDVKNDDSDGNDNDDMSVNELLRNSEKLLKNVDKVLNDVTQAKKVEKVKKDLVKVEIVEQNKPDKVETKKIEEKKEIRNRKAKHKLRICADMLPPGALCTWGAELLTALESLHNYGVICRDLNPKNILLGNNGQITLTYCLSYPEMDMTLSKLETRVKPGEVDMYVAPELYSQTIMDSDKTDKVNLDSACDFWSYGAILYELLCGVPLSYYHRSVFTSHTILQCPEGLSVEVESLLTQLLTYDPEERLGAGKDGIEEIKRHPYFKNIDWQYIYDSWIVPD